ncbi:MAG: PASTA domain-containing protein [Sedimentisphaerales bacterium]
MRKALLIVAMLLAVSPLMASVTITAVQEGTYATPDGNIAAIIRIGYTGTGLSIRAFALDINVDSGCTFGNIRDFNIGENNYPNTPSGYGIFPGRFRQYVSPTNYNWSDSNYNPTPYYNDPGALGTGIGYGSIIAELGYLGAPNIVGGTDMNAPPLSGTLFRIDVNAYAFRGDANLTVAADAMRGGVVDVCTNSVTTNMPFTIDVCFPSSCTNIPDLTGMTKAQADAAIIAANAGFTPNGAPVVGCTGTYGIVLPGFDTGCFSPPHTVNYTYEAGKSITGEVGVDRATAEAAWIAQGFGVSGTPSVSCTGTYNAVLTQDTGCKAQGYVVNYTYEAGKTIANEVGQTVANAQSAWTGQGFANGTGTPVPTCPAGLIISQDTGCKAQGYAVNYSYGSVPAVPNVVGMTRANAVTALTNAGFVAGASSTDVCSWGTATVNTVGNVFNTSPAVGATPGCGTTVTLSVVVYPIKPTATTNSFYANWVSLGKPQCWAYPRQCHGNADGKEQLSLYWVGSNELTILRGAFNKNPVPAGTGICAAFDHKKQLSLYWVGSNDLTLLRAYFNKAASLVPVCGVTGASDPNFWYFCNPTGVACPAGVTCATAPICPNTP